MEIRDRYQVDAADVRMTPDGYLVAQPRVARTGIQLYKGSELGRPELDTVRVYRPEDQVFDKASMQTFAYRPITNDHPPEQVSADNWRKYSVGQSGGEIARDGEFMRVPMVVMDAAAIEDVKAGKVELSVGYSADLKWGDGKTPEGEQYDAMQTNIRANHIAIVTAARGGAKLKLGDKTKDASGDDNKGALEMQTQIVDIDGVKVEMSDIAHSVVLRHIKGLESRLGDLKGKLEAAEAAMKDANTAHETAIAAAKKEGETKDAKIATLEQQAKDAELTPAKLDQAVRDRAGIVSKAKSVLGDKLVVDGKSDVEIMKQVVSAKMGDASKDWNDEQVRTSFLTLTASVKPTDSLAKSFATGTEVTDAEALRDKMYADRDAKLSQAWRGKAA